MVRLRRSNIFIRDPAMDPGSDAYQDPPAEVFSDEAISPSVSPHVDAPLSQEAGFTTDVDSLLPEAQMSAQACRREHRLVEAACRGENSAIEALYRTHYDTIYRYVLLRLGSVAAAEDVTSQVFLGMVRGLGRYRDEGKPFVAWLYGIAQKQIAFFQRGQSRAPGKVDLDAAAELAAQSAGPDATAEQRELRGRIAHALGKVPEGQREVLMLRYILSLSVAETAAIVGRTEGAVKQLQLRGLTTLKNLLGTQGLPLH